jgi:large subunit ribosomal protein L22
MKVKAASKYLRISPRKARLVADTIRGQKVTTAFDILKFTPKVGAKLVEKTLKSAMANAEHNLQLSKNDLVVSEILVDEGPTLKRFRPRARGSAYTVRKRTAHIVITLDDLKGEKKVAKEAKAEVKNPEVTEEKNKETKEKKVKKEGK